MKKLYYKYFCILEHEKVSEKVFITRTFLSVLSMLLCLVILCSATFAYFTASIYSGENTITTASYSLNVSDTNAYPYSLYRVMMLNGDIPTISDNNIPSVSGNDVPADNVTGKSSVSDNDILMVSEYDASIRNVDEEMSYVCKGARDHTYIFVMEASGTAENGYCKVVINGNEANSYYTQQIAQGAQLTLTVIADDNTIVTLEPSWGFSEAFIAGETTYGGEEILNVKSSAD